MISFCDLRTAGEHDSVGVGNRKAGTQILVVFPGFLARGASHHQRSRDKASLISLL